MMMRVVAWSSRHPWIVITLALLLAAAGELGRRALARDVTPDLSDPQIVLVGDWMGHPATQVASEVTNVLTGALEGVPGSTAVRGSSMSGMAYVDVVFSSPADLGPGRAQILERVAGVRPRLPVGVRVQVGPAASSTDWVFEYALTDSHRSLVELRRFQDDVLRPALSSLPGVAEVAAVGGGIQELAVEVRLAELRQRGLAFTDVLDAVRAAILANPRATLEEIQTRVVEPGPVASPALVRDVAQVQITEDMPSGLADLGGVFQAVGGIVVAERGADPSAVARRVGVSLDRIRAGLPPGMRLVTTYDRLDLVDRVEASLVHAVGEEIAVVALIILVFLLHGRSALVTLLTLPAALLLTFSAMWIFHLPATLMSLGGIGIAIGIAVDADVVALEACHRRLSTGDATGDRRATLVSAAASFTPAILTSLIITALSFLPVLAFTGETGRLLRPLALTKTLVIFSATVVTLTLAPALRDRLLRGRIRPELDHPLTPWLVRAYRPFVLFALRRPLLTVLTAALLVASAVPVVPRLGREFLPRIDEGDLLFMPTTLPGVPPEETLVQLRGMDRTIAAFPEVATVFGKVGRADTATDPAGYAMVETTVRLRPRSEWPASGKGPATTAELVERLDQATRLPGWTNAWTAPVRARMDMMSTGVRTPIGIRVVARSPERLEALGGAVRTVLSRVQGARSVVFESLGGESRLEFDADGAALARHGVDAATARATASLLLTGGQIGEVEQAGRRLRVRVHPGATAAADGPADLLREVTVRGSGEAALGPVPLALLGRPIYRTVPATLRSERGELVGYLSVDLDAGTDLLGYVQQAERALDGAVMSKELSFDAGERTEWAGQYTLMVAGERRLKWIIPLVALSMLGLLFLQFRSFVEAVIILASVPFALVGSVWALLLLGYPLSAPVWVGLLSVLGLAMQTGVVMVVYIDEAFYRRVRDGTLKSRDDIVQAHLEGTVQRLRPKLMTIATMAGGLLPLLFANGAGAEIMKRVAVPMIGGLATSAFLTLEVIPVLYTVWRHRQLLRAQQRGVAIAEIVGTAPAWLR
jgi:Cu(I)/Ag(I) efflux system membrane protein CusA/SilA